MLYMCAIAEDDTASSLTRIFGCLTLGYTLHRAVCSESQYNQIYRSSHSRIYQASQMYELFNPIRCPQKIESILKCCQSTPSHFSHHR